MIAFKNNTCTKNPHKFKTIKQTILIRDNIRGNFDQQLLNSTYSITIMPEKTVREVEGI